MSHLEAQIATIAHCEGSLTSSPLSGGGVFEVKLKRGHKTFFSWLPWFESILLDILRFCLNHTHTHTHHFKCTGSSLMDFTVGTLMVYCGYCR